MYISDFSIRRPLATIVAMVTLVVFGLFALWRLQTDEYPDIQQPVLLVVLPYPGGSPGDTEEDVLTPVEDAVAAISGIDHLYGTAADGYAQLLLLFKFGKDMDVASQEVRDAISSIRSDLPDELKEPVIRRLDPADFPVISVVLASTSKSPAELTRVAEDDVQKALEAVPGVARVTVSGGEERALTVDLHPDALTSAGIDMAQVVTALQSQNLAAPVGRINAPGEEQSLRFEGRLQDPSSFVSIPVGTGLNGRTVMLGEVATVRDAAEEARTLALLDGKEAVGVDVVKTREASTTTVSKAIGQAVARLQPMLPPDVNLRVVRDSGVRVAASVANVEEALALGAFLTVLVVFLFLNSWRSTIITGLALPVSVLSSFIAVWAFGFTLNTMSLLGLSLAIGILIDDAIVVRENIVRHHELGADARRAAHEGTDEIGLAVAATTFSIVSVFVPVAFITGVAGQWFKPFALTIACAVLVSLFVSFSLDPMLSAYWPDPKKPEALQGPITRALNRFNAWFNGLADRYRRLVGWALDHPKTILLIATASFAGALALPATGLVGGGFFPPTDNSEFTVHLETPPGTDLATMADRARAVSTIIRRHPEVVLTYATLGDGQGSVDVGDLYVSLKPVDQRSVSAEALAAAVRAEVARVPGVEAAVATGAFSGGQKQIQLQLQSTDRMELQTAADSLLRLVAHVPGAVDVGLSTRGQKPELKVAPDRDRDRALGLSAAQVALALRPAFAGQEVGTWVDPTGKPRHVIVRLDSAARTSAASASGLPIHVPGAHGTMTVLLGEVAQLEDGLGPALITHLDRTPDIVVEANAQGRPLSGVTADIEAALARHPLPKGVSLTQGGEVESQNEVFGEIFSALGLGVLIMYLVLVLQFGSFLDPLAILVSLPLSLIGVMGALLATGQTINIMSLIGVILLAGIVAKNAILLIDFAKVAKERGLQVREALIEAGGIRLRPILMTTTALIAGMLPVALGHGEGALFRRPLGVAVIGGVLTSTLLTLLVIPVVWELLDRLRTRVMPRRTVPASLLEESPVSEPVA